MIDTSFRIQPFLTGLVLASTLGILAPPPLVAAGDEPLVMEGRILTGQFDEKALVERATPRRLDPSAPAGYEIRLAPFPAAAVVQKSEPVKGFGAPLRIGRHRELPAAYRVEMRARDLQWEPARGGGEVAVFSLTSPGARAVRLALDFHQLPTGAEVRFYSPSRPVAESGFFEASFLAPRHKAFAAADPFWSPVVHGDTARVEIWVPAWRRGADVRLAVRRVAHIEHSLEGKDLSHIGSSGSCNRDVACFKKWTTAADAVAKIVFEFGGGSALCTGQLMANEKEKFLFLTAAHCISSRSAAASMTMFWRFQRASCGGANPSDVMQTGGGGRLLFTSSSLARGLVTDHTLMELKRDPTKDVGPLPGLGWMVGADPDDNLRAKVHGVHHPAGDVQKGSRGKVEETWQLQPDGSLAGANPPTHYQVVWKKGTTEGGSSGSPILTGRRWPQQFVVGVLTGGLASCSQRREPDFYGLFEETFRRYKKFRKHFN